MSVAAEDAIRLYLRWIKDPKALIDAEKVAALEALAARAEDPLAQIKAFNDLDRARAVDGDRIRAGFVAHAKAWAAANDISVEAFRRMQVGEDDLRAAGLLGGPTKVKTLTPVAPSEDRERRSRTPASEVERHVPRSGEFTVRSVAEASGASDATVRKVIEGLVADGTVIETGTARASGTRGRAATAYRHR